jgi:hypothetical protein
VSRHWSAIDARSQLLRWWRQNADPALQRSIVALADDDAHVPLVLIDERLPQRREISCRCVFGLTFFGGNCIRTPMSRSLRLFLAVTHGAVFPAAHRRSNPFGVTVGYATPSTATAMVFDVLNRTAAIFWYSGSAKKSRIACLSGNLNRTIRCGPSHFAHWGERFRSVITGCLNELDQWRLGSLDGNRRATFAAKATLHGTPALGFH